MPNGQYIIVRKRDMRIIFAQGVYGVFFHNVQIRVYNVIPMDILDVLLAYLEEYLGIRVLWLL